VLPLAPRRRPFDAARGHSMPDRGTGALWSRRTAAPPLMRGAAQAEGLVEKLCHRFRGTEDRTQWRDIAYCLSMLNYSDRCIKKVHRPSPPPENCTENDCLLRSSSAAGTGCCRCYYL
jgi:hypothetical protein